MIPFRTTLPAAAALFGFALVFALVTDAFAQSLRVRCEVRDDRSKASVDGNDLRPRNGDFVAVLQSGDRMAASGVQTAIGDEVEFDFDSEPDDIAEGATAIAADFIQGRRAKATGTLINATTNEVVISATVRCRDRR